MKVLFLTRYDRLGSSSRLRALQYLPLLRRQGIECQAVPLLGDDYVSDLYAGRAVNVGNVMLSYLRRVRHLLGCRRYDLLWIEKELFPWLPAISEALLDLRGPPYVVDYDDAFFHRYDMHHNPLVRKLLGRNIDRVMKHAALVIAGNDYLAERAVRAGARRVEVLPTVIDLERYPVVPLPARSGFTIGWIGSPSTSPCLLTIQQPLQELCRAQKSRLVLVGADGRGLSELDAEIRPWSEEREAEEIRTFDVGIMPLQDRPWERGKCGYKLIQYMACGLPVVASPVGVNSRIVTHGDNGFLAASAAEWLSALTRLRDDVTLRGKMGRAGRARVEESYCLQVTAPHLGRLLASAARQQ